MNTYAIFKEIYKRKRDNEPCEHLVVDIETFMQIKNHTEYIPDFLSREKVSTFLGLKIDVENDIIGWEIR